MTGKGKVAKRRLCPCCGLETALRDDGTLYRHRYYGRKRQFQVGSVCPGSGLTLKSARERVGA